MLHWIYRVSGWIGGVILILSLYFVATVVRMFMELRKRWPPRPSWWRKPKT